MLKSQNQPEPSKTQVLPRPQVPSHACEQDAMAPELASAIPGGLAFKERECRLVCWNGGLYLATNGSKWGTWVRNRVLSQVVC